MKRNSIFIILSLMGLSAVYIFIQLMSPIWVQERIEVYVKKGMSFKEASTLLSEKGLIKDKNLFVALGRLTGLDKRLKPGYYSFWGAINTWHVFKAIRDGVIIKNVVTVIEGDSLVEIKKKLSQGGVMTEGEFEGLAQDHSFLRNLDIDAPSFEGYLFPDTYNFPKGTSAEDVFRFMVMRLRQEYDGSLRQKAERLGLSEKEVLTLASIIEKEAVLDEERPIVSAVYHNRLKKGMHLQADPTAIYGIKPHSERITKNDLKRKTQYNTYIIKGLPPGPIASAGIKSIRAALSPTDTPFLYFVSNNDGTHKFSVTSSEHLQAVEENKNKKALANKEKNKEGQRQ